MSSVRVLRASAGSGKTFRLAYEYVAEAVADPLAYRHILAVTFTNKATEEMKHRIVTEIDRLARGEVTPYLGMLLEDSRISLDAAGIQRRAAEVRSNILHDYSRFAVLTIDKFFQRIIRSFLHELGIELSFNLELRTDTILEGAADELIDQIAADPVLHRWVTGFVEERIENNRRWNIASELASLGREIFSEGFRAVAISKEELHRIVSDATSQAEAAVARMRATAREALALIEGAGLQPADFAYGANGLTSYFVAMAAGEVKPYGKRVTDALADDAKWYTKTSPLRALIEGLIPDLRPLLQRLCDLYDDDARLVNSAAILRENYRSFALLSDLSARVEQICTARNVLPIAQTDNIIRRLVEGNDAPFIFEKSGSHFTRFMIDEFQDTSLVQWQNFLPLLRNAVSQSDRQPVLLVGDVKQSIYRWRGGDWRILARDVRDAFRQVEEGTLDRNFRSLRNIIKFNNSLVASCVERDNDALNERLAQAANKGLISGELCGELTDTLHQAYADLHQQARDGAEGGHITVTHYAAEKDGGDENDVGEAGSGAGTPMDGGLGRGDGMPPVIERVTALQRQGFAAGDIAILVRSHREGSRLVELFMEHKRRLAAASVPPVSPESPTAAQAPLCFDVVTQEALQIGYAQVVGFVIAVLRLSLDQGDAIARTIFNRRQGDITRGEVSEAEAAFFRRVGLLPPIEAFESIVERYRLGEERTDAAYLQALEQQIINFCLTSVADTTLFLRWWDENGATESINLPGDTPAITIITIHKAKGLQYPAVIVPFCDWPLTPGKDTVLWGDFGDSPFAQAGVMPVKYRTALGESYLAADYYRELVYSHIDNINILYVALTRAEQELHIMLKRRKKPQEGQSLVSALVRAAVPPDGVPGATVTLGPLEGRVESFGGQGVGAVALGGTAGAESVPARVEPSTACGCASSPTEAGSSAEGWRRIVQGGNSAKRLAGRSPQPVGVGDMAEVRTVRPEDVTISFGEPCRPALKEGAGRALEIRFAAASPRAKLRMRLQSQRYFSDEQQAEFSPRRMGILLHRVFEQAEDASRLGEGVRRLVLDGAVSPAEAQGLEAAIAQALADPMVGEWFSDKWKVIRNENDIITPGGGSLRRPDRVMVGEGGCVVVDYKFGTQQPAAHRRQIEDYAALLRAMGYPDVRGYIWYIAMGEVVAV